MALAGQEAPFFFDWIGIDLSLKKDCCLSLFDLLVFRKESIYIGKIDYICLG